MATESKPGASAPTPAPSPYIVGRIPKLPPKYVMVVMPLLMSGMMSCVISFVNTARALGWVPGLASIWFVNWMLSWAIAFPTVMLVMPLVKRITQRLVRM